MFHWEKWKIPADIFSLQESVSTMEREMTNIKHRLWVLIPNKPKKLEIPLNSLPHFHNPNNHLNEVYFDDQLVIIHLLTVSLLSWISVKHVWRHRVTAFVRCWGNYLTPSTLGKLNRKGVHEKTAFFGTKSRSLVTDYLHEIGNSESLCSYYIFLKFYNCH